MATTRELREIEYHSARLLLLMSQCGSPKTSPKLRGRTLLAKLDFFLRYPVYLEKAVGIRTGGTLEQLVGEGLRDHERDNVESRMIRYKYGPWDNTYYLVWTYLLAKNLINIELREGVEYFELTLEGQAVVNTLSSDTVFKDIIERARALKLIFPRWSGTRVKEFIYKEFREIVSLPLGEEIR